MPTDESFLANLPEDKEALKAILRALLQERDNQRQRAEAQTKRAEELQKKTEEQRKHADELYLENLWLQKELLRYKKASYGPRADRLSENELAQVLLEFAEELEQKPLPAESIAQGEAGPEVRRVRRRKGRRALANFENLPASTHVYELPAEQRLCPCCGVERKEIGSQESWQIEYIPGHFERIQHPIRQSRRVVHLVVTARQPAEIRTFGNAASRFNRMQGMMILDVSSATLQETNA